MFLLRLRIVYRARLQPCSKCVT